MSKERTLVIAHRGASGYLPEHTLGAKALAYAMGADFLEQDLVATRDDELIVLHDIHVDRVSNVADVYPGRARADGRFYARDFDFAELVELSVSERFDEEGEAVYPGRYPVRSGAFRIHTFQEELELVAALNEASGKHVGIYPEIKRPAWHQAEGVDIAPGMLSLLAEYGYTQRASRCYLQCFDPVELKRIRVTLQSDLKLVQLIGDNSWQESRADYDAMRQPSALKQLATVADSIGPWLAQCFVVDGGEPRSSGLVEAAHAVGLAVHPYTVRADSLPDGFPSHDALVHFCRDTIRVDGLFTDFPDLTRTALDQRAD